MKNYMNILKTQTKQCILSVVVVRFLNKKFKPLMKWYYSTYKKQEIYHCLKLFYDYKDIKGGVDLRLAVDILSKDNDWDIERARKALGYCVYCGYIS